MTAAEDHARAVLDCYQCYADACIEHDPEHGRRACDELHQLIPAARQSSESNHSADPNTPTFGLSDVPPSK